VGEVQRVRPNRNGHLFFELIEKGDADEIVGKLEAVIWRRDYQKVQRALADVGHEIAEGQELRLRATPDFYAPYGRLQLVVREVDVVFSLGQMAARRRETLKALSEAGLLDRNAQLPLSRHPLDIALVTARNSAAFHDFLETLRESGFGFRVSLIDAAVQGRDAERAVSTALTQASRLPIDACVLIRGGGSKTDLAAFDSRRVAEAVARSAVPVLTGLGHQIDESIADRVAHTALKTPTKVAEFLVERLVSADRDRMGLEAALAVAARQRVGRGLDHLARAEARVLVTRHRLVAARARVAELGRFLARTATGIPRRAGETLARTQRRLASAAPRPLALSQRRTEATVRSVVRASQGRLRTATATLEGHGRLAVQLSPDRVLARGFSITRDEEGRAVRRADEIRYGQALETQLAVGTVRSRVEE